MGRAEFISGLKLLEPVLELAVGEWGEIEAVW